MKKILITCILFLPLFALAQSHSFSIDKEKLRRFNLPLEGWLYKAGDDSTWARQNLDDKTWTPVNSLLIKSLQNNQKVAFDGVAWFRLHIHIDSNALRNKTLGLRMLHVGASEIYIDGKRVMTFGVINGKDSTVHHHPQNVPFSVPGLQPGDHVLAVRYANYIAADMEAFDEQPGFMLSIGYMNDLVDDLYANLTNSLFVFTALLGVFAALSFIHLFLYLYHRSNHSNLYFSLFSFAIAMWLYSVYISTLSFDLDWIIFFTHTLALSVITSCFALSGFNNSLFSTNKLRFRIIAALCLLCIIGWVFARDIASRTIPILVGIVLLETIFLDIRAIYRRLPGSRIIGLGISFFALFVVTSLTFAIINGGLSFEPDSIGAFVFIILGVLAIISIPGSISIYLAWSFSRVSKDLSKQLHQVQFLSEKTLQQEQEKQHILENQKEQLEREVAVRTSEVTSQKEQIEKQHEELKSEKQKSDNLLLNILPEEIADELKETGTTSAKHFDNVTVLFTDFVDFTKAGERMSPQELVDELHTCFKAFDEIISRHNIEKIKTIGDAYLAVAGLPQSNAEHALNIARAAIEIRNFINQRKHALPDKSFHIRIGIHSGSVIAGIVGVKKFAYDIWGDTVNTAARMEQHGEPGKINISKATYDLISDKFECHYRGKITAKNKGEMNMYFVEREL